MRTEIVRSGERTTAVRSRNRRTALVQAQYMQALRRAYPELAAYELDQLKTPLPSLPMSDKGDFLRPLTEAEQAIYDAYNSATLSARAQHQVGAIYFDVMAALTPLLARIVTVGGAPFQVNGDGNLPDVQAAFEDFLEDDNAPDGFWFALAEAVKKLDAPLTTAIEKPLETLTEAEQADPLLVTPASAIASA